MDIAEFEDLLDRLGEDMSRWPSAQQSAALALLAESDEARELLREAEAMRGLLSGPSVRAPAGLADRIISQAKQHAATSKIPEQGRALERMSQWLSTNLPVTRAAFLSLCFVLGLFVGIFHDTHHANEINFHEFVAYIADMVQSSN